MRTGEAASIFLKGAGMGAANVIPGVSGGTIALITGIYPRLIQALRHASQPATIRNVFGGKWAEAWSHFDGWFLVALGVGIAASILSLARLFDFLLEFHEVATMAFFFGLVLVSIVHVGRSVPQWNATRISALVIGAVIAAGLALIAPASANAAFGYLVVCGIAAICSMILPGLSGSFVLMLMGNYILVIRALKEFDLGIILPVAIGCGAGLLGFVQILGIALKRAPHTVIALMTGFVVGSLLTIWPWKIPVAKSVEVAGEMKEIVTGYRWELPTQYDANFFIAIAFMVVGGIALHFMQSRASQSATMH